jgi:hypothetical protein
MERPSQGAFYGASHEHPTKRRVPVKSAIVLAVMMVDVIWENPWWRGLIIGLAIGLTLAGLAFLLPDDQPTTRMVP